MGFSDVLSLPLLFQRSFNAYAINIELPTAMLIYHVQQNTFAVYITFKRLDLSSLLGFPSQTDVAPNTCLFVRIVYIRCANTMQCNPIHKPVLTFHTHTHTHTVTCSCDSIETIHIHMYTWIESDEATPFNTTRYQNVR